jgi:protein-S-isoprenylcysteine O-methyltransferase Ste14
MKDRKTLSSTSSTAPYCCFDSQVAVCYDFEERSSTDGSMKIIGKETIHPVLFYTGKFSGYFTWILLLLSILGAVDIGRNPAVALVWFAYFVSAAGLCLSTISILNLGRSTRLGLPTERTEFKTKGLYKFSRNPMYVGFNLVTLSSVIYHANLIILAMGVFNVVVYHLIILGEEAYLREEFGSAYKQYMVKVRRYV